MKLLWTAAARADLEEVVDFLLEENPAVARDVLERIEAAARALLDHPRLGRPGRVAGTRERVVPGLPWILPYALQADAVVILRVLHGARRWPTGF